MVARKSALRLACGALLAAGIGLGLTGPRALAAGQESATPDGQEAAPQASPAAEEPSAGMVATVSPAPDLGKAQQITLLVLAEKVARYPDNPHVLNEYGNELLHKGRPDEAVAVYRRAVALNPESAQIWNNLGVAYNASQHYRKAISSFKRSLEIAPAYALVHYNLGVTYDSQGRYEKALRSYERAIEIDPSLLDVKKNPQIKGNKHVIAILTQIYVDRGGQVLFPVVSSYPKPHPKP